MGEELEELVESLKKVEKEPRKNKWECPICSGASLSKGKVVSTVDQNLNIDVTTSLGELEISVDDGENILEHIKYHIRYCPWCGRKVREPYRKRKAS